MSKGLEAFKRATTMVGFYDYNENQYMEDLKIIETALKQKEQQDNIIKIIKEIIAFDKTLPDIKVDENNALSITSGIAMRFQREIENKERELFRDWILKECFPKEMKALEIIKEKGVNLYKLKMCNSVEEYNRLCNTDLPLTQEEYDLLNEVLL